MKKIDHTIEWLIKATQILKEVEVELRELNYELDKNHEKNIRAEIRAEYGPDKEEHIMEFVTGELGDVYESMTIRQIMDEIGSADMCEWCGETTNEHSAEIMSMVGTEQVCVYCKRGE